MYLLFYRHVIEKRLGLANPDKNQLNVTFSLLCKLVLIYLLHLTLAFIMLLGATITLYD